MRADLQAVLNNPAQAISTGQLSDQKLLVFDWLALQAQVPLVTLTPANIVNKAIGMQGISDVNLLDLQIYGLANKLGVLSLGFPSLLASAYAAIDGANTGAGFVSPASGLQVNIGSPDYRAVWKYIQLSEAFAVQDSS
jgi:hypothetical protein